MPRPAPRSPVTGSPVTDLVDLVHRAVTASLGVLLLTVTAVALLSPRNSWFVFEPVVVLGVWGGAVAVVAGVVVLARRRGASGESAGGAAGGAADGSAPSGTTRHPWTTRPWTTRHPWTTVWLGTALGALASSICAAASTIPFGWDARAVVQAAQVLAAGGELDPHGLDYFARFPNNVPLLALESLLARGDAALGLPTPALAIGLQVAAASTVTACLGATAVVLGRPGRVLPVQGASLVLLGLSPHLATPYTDVPAAACVAVAVLALAVALTARRATPLAVAAVAIGLAMALKPFVAVLLVALVLVALLGVATGTGGRGAGRRGAGRLGVVLVACVIALTAVGTTLVTTAVAGRVTGLTDERLAEVRAPFPVALWLAAGTYDSQEDSPVRRYGAYRQDLVDLAASIDDPRRRQEVLLDRARTQVAERGVAGNLAFFGPKVAWVWGDGTFWAHGEGTDSRQQTRHTGGPLAQVASWSVATGEHYRLRASVVQGLWLALLTCLGVGLLRQRPDRLVTTWSLSLIGLTAYLLIFEARPRYVVALLPVLLALVASVGTDSPRRMTGPEAPTTRPAGRGLW